MEELWRRIKRLLSEFTHFQKRNRIKRYGLPILLISIIFLSKHHYHQFLGNNSAFLVVSFVVAMSSWYGGFGPGVFATIILAVLTFFLFLQADVIYHPLNADLVLTVIFLIEGFIISLASEARYEMEEQKDEFIGFVAHELKNPLAAISGFAGLITNSARRSGDDKISYYADSISVSSDKMLELINDLLDITKIEIGKFTYSNSFFNLSDLAKEVITRQRIINKNRIIELKGSSKKALYGDQYRIGQVIANLLTNAIKYSPETKRIVVRLSQDNERVLLSVKDYGLGISVNDQKKIFSRFYRTDKVQRSKSEGLGLGLFICDQIIKHHKGSLWVESKEGKGSTFFLELPTQMPQ